jgi:glycosyltransferase involved in cell wall biosynthesis
MPETRYFLTAPAVVSEVLCTRQSQVIKQGDASYQQAELVIAITHKNQSEFLARALASALKQNMVQQKTARIVVLDDGSSADEFNQACALAEHPAITLLAAECGSPARARNMLLDWADKQPAVQWVARLDADDELASDNSVHALWQAAVQQKAIAAIGSNRLRLANSIIAGTNYADANQLLNAGQLVAMVQRFCHGQQQHELPSCNLLLRTQVGLRYPNIRSAEDHWLVLRLLLLYPKQVVCVANPVYCIYSLEGADTQHNKQNQFWQEQRLRLAVAAQSWLHASKLGYNILGSGMEGIVWCNKSTITKQFYPWAIEDKDVIQLQQLMAKPVIGLPAVTWHKQQGRWCYTTPRRNTRAVGQLIGVTQITKFLRDLYQAGVCALNIKRDNLLLDADNTLLYIDIGKDIQPLTTAYFLDMAARLYSIGVLGNDDEELVRRNSLRKADAALMQLPGFAAFYQQLISALHPHCLVVKHNDNPVPVCTNVTLLIKACAQDAAGLQQQIAHIVTQLSYPQRFAQVVLLIDSFSGPFLRQYAKADLPAVIAQAQALKDAGLIDDVWLSPGAETEQAVACAQQYYQQWFGNNQVTASHTVNNAPLLPQIWAFSQVTTRYVLQCDSDVLIGRKCWQHDYLADMLDAIAPADVHCVGFNISKDTAKGTAGFLPYHGEPGQFPPEVRLGLLDLARIKACLPIANPMQDGRFCLTWHRALQAQQKLSGARSVRGGNPDSFYVHPRNEHKAALCSGVIRDLIAQGTIPADQAEQFDLQPDARWQYPSRAEPVVFLLKGRFTETALLQCCLTSLRQQTVQRFGIILIDDGSGAEHNWQYPLLLADLMPKTTLVRHNQHQGRMPNFIQAIEQLCTNPDTLIAVLDQDDCLMQNTVVSQLLKAAQQGTDLVQLPMFRPNKPLKLYIPNYTAPRAKAAANVWAHLRVFKKRLFERVPKAYFKHGDTWFDTVTDYVTMLPMAELATKPVYLDTGYAYWHQRLDYGPAEKQREHQLIAELLAKPALANTAAAPKPVDTAPEP